MIALKRLKRLLEVLRMRSDVLPAPCPSCAREAARQDAQFQYHRRIWRQS